MSSALPNPLVPAHGCESAAQPQAQAPTEMATNTALVRGSTHYGSSATDAEVAWLRRCLPIFVQPDVDIKNRNELVKIFFRFERNELSGGLACKLCIVFAGESCYNRVQEEIENTVATICYRTFNRRTYKRTADINYMEFTNVDLEASSTAPWASIRTQDHSGAQQWAQGEKRDVGSWFSLMHHYHADVSYTDWKVHSESHRPYIYLNTCNHMIGQRDNNPRLSKFEWTDYPFQEGDGDDAFHYVVDHVPTKCNLYSYLCFWQARNGGGCCDRHQGGSKSVSRDGKSIFMQHPDTALPTKP